MENSRLFDNLTDPKTGGAAYSVAAVLPFIFSVAVSIALGALAAFGVIPKEYSDKDWYIYMSYLLPQFSFFFTAAYFLSSTKTKLTSFYAPAKAKYFAVAIALQFGLFSLSAINGYFLEFLKNIGFENVSDGVPLPSFDGFGFILAVIVIAVLPAIFEESLFRGIMTESLKKFGTLWCVFISGALFALFHGNPAQTVYQFICGCAFALIAVKSKSVLPTVLSHFLNNLFILSAIKFGFEEITASPTFLIISAAALVASLLYLLLADRNKIEVKAKKGISEFFIYASVGIFVCLASWIAGLFV